jgi:hypothetical protein
MMPLIEIDEPSVPEIGPCCEKQLFKTFPSGYSEFASQVGFPSIDSFSLDGDEDKDDLPVDDYKLVERKNETDPVGTERAQSGSRNTSLNTSAMVAKL